MERPCTFLAFKRQIDCTADKLSKRRHAGSQFPGAGNGWGLRHDEGLQQAADVCQSTRLKYKLAFRSLAGEPGCGAMLTCDIPAKLQVVSQNEVGEAAQVTLHLVGVLGFIEGNTDIFGLDITKRSLFIRDDKVRSAAGNTLGLIGSGKAREDGFHECFQSGTVCMFGSVASL